MKKQPASMSELGVMAIGVVFLFSGCVQEYAGLNRTFAAGLATTGLILLLGPLVLRKIAERYGFGGGER